MAQAKKRMRHASGVKAHRQALRRATRNRFLRRSAREAARAAVASAKTADQAKTKKLLAEAGSIIDRAAKRGVIHWKAAARRKSRLAARLRQAAPTASAPASK